MMSEWQPIETAPKDGTYVLVGNAGGAWVAGYCATYQSGFSPANPWLSLFLNHDHIKAKAGERRSFVPTHWMPLPKAPE